MPTTEHDDTGEPLLETVDLSSVRGNRLLFDGLAVSVNSGEVVQIHGPNGSGKTTLLRILCGLQPPVDGRVHWRGRAVAPAAPGLRAEVQYIGHTGGVKLELTPRENLDIAVALSSRPTGTTPHSALARLEIERFHDVPVRTLSAGQRQRVALARLLTCESTLWILDEPFTALDARGVSIIDSMLHEHTREGGAAVITSHHPVALRAVHPRLIRIEQGP